MSVYKNFDQHIKIRVDDTLLGMLAKLAKEANRTPSAYLRDMIFFLSVSQVGIFVNAHILNENIHYRPMKPVEKTERNWDHNQPEYKQAGK